MKSEDPSKIDYSVETISGYLDQNLTDSIKRVTGVGSVTYYGNRELAIRIWLDPNKLAAMEPAGISFLEENAVVFHWHG